MHKLLSKKNFGFTLIELLIVVAILGVLGTFVIIRFTGSQASARDVKRQSEIKQYQTSLEVYANRNNFLYPATPSGGNAVNLCSALNLTNCPNDPATGQNYRYGANGARTEYVLWARMERRNTQGQIEYYVVCSNGKNGKSTTQPSGANCPL